MTFFLKSSPALITALILVFFFSYSYGQEWQTPLIEGYGEIKYFDNAAEQLNLNQEYKLLFDVTSDKQKKRGKQATLGSGENIKYDACFWRSLSKY